MDVRAYDSAIARADQVFQQASSVGFDLHLLDIGGGFPGYDDRRLNSSALQRTRHTLARDMIILEVRRLKLCLATFCLAWRPFPNRMRIAESLPNRVGSTLHPRLHWQQMCWLVASWLTRRPRP